MSNNIKLQSVPKPVNLTLSSEPIIIPIGVDAYYVHSQDSSSDTWVINHNLSKYCSVMVVDSDDEVIYGNVVYNSTNQLTITFNAQITGKAYLN
jgi:hypothetical protein